MLSLPARDPEPGHLGQDPTLPSRCAWPTGQTFVKDSLRPKARLWALVPGWGGSLPAFFHLTDISQASPLGQAHVVLERKQRTRQTRLPRPQSGGETDILYTGRACGETRRATHSLVPEGLLGDLKGEVWVLLGRCWGLGFAQLQTPNCGSCPQCPHSSWWLKAQAR